MDACLELLLPGIVQAEGFEFVQPCIVWRGTTYPQGPASLKWGEFVELVQTPIPEHLRGYIPADKETENWIALSIRGTCLDLLQDEVNGVVVDWKGRSLEALLRLLLLQYTRWVLVFEWHCDQIDSVYRINVEQCVERLRQNLRWETSTEGFVVISPEGQ